MDFKIFSEAFNYIVEITEENYWKITKTAKI